RRNPNPRAPANIRTAVGEEFEQYAKQEGADHVDAERGNRYTCHPARQRGDQATECGTSASTDRNESDIRPRQMRRWGVVWMMLNRVQIRPPSDAGMGTTT